MDNFSFLSIFDESVYDYCHQIELLVKTQPTEAMVNLRKALEAFVTTLYKQRRFPSDPKPDLHAMISALRGARVFTYDQTGALHEIRKKTNGAAHPDERYTSSEVLKWVAPLHKVMQEYLRYNRKLREVTAYNPDAIPIGGFVPVTKLKVETTTEACEAKYLCQKTNERTHNVTTYVVRQFNKEKQANKLNWLQRDEYALEQLWSHEPPPQNVVRYHPVFSANDNNLFFSCYEIAPGTATLGELKLKSLTVRQKLDILYGIANGLDELHSLEPPIVHRYLTPASVYIVPGKNDQHIAKVGNFEYSKLHNPYDGTMLQRYEERTDVYRAPELAGNIEHEWTAVDVYSLGVVTLYMFGLRVDGFLDAGQLKRFQLSPSFIDTVQKMVNNAQRVRPAIRTIKNVIQEEAFRHE